MTLRKKSTRRIVLAVLLASALIYVLPLLIIFTNSFMSPGEVLRH